MFRPRIAAPLVPTRRAVPVLPMRLAAVAVLAASCGGSGSPLEPISGPGDYARTVESGGQTRSYELHVPKSVDPSLPAPLVVVLHGVPRGAGMRAITGFDEAAARYGFVVAYARAAEVDWAVGCELCTSAARKGVDDVRYVRDLIARTSAELSVDPDRVFAVGFSQGALMAHLLACRLQRLAGLASVAATMIEPVWTACVPVTPRAALFVHGSEDPEFPDDGRSGDLVSTVSLTRSVDRWRALNDCSGEPEETAVPDVAEDGTRTVLSAWRDCRAGASVVLYAVEGGGHTWPGSPLDFPDAFGRRSEDFSATDVIAAFFDGAG